MRREGEGLDGGGIVRESGSYGEGGVRRAGTCAE